VRYAAIAIADKCMRSKQAGRGLARTAHVLTFIDVPEHRDDVAAGILSLRHSNFESAAREHITSCRRHNDINKVSLVPLDVPACMAAPRQTLACHTPLLTCLQAHACSVCAARIPYPSLTYGMGSVTVSLAWH
jgi:hypothetical protein